VSVATSGQWAWMAAAHIRWSSSAVKPSLCSSSVVVCSATWEQMKDALPSEHSKAALAVHVRDYNLEILARHLTNLEYPSTGVNTRDTLDII
jgi:hypothetical protein